jgi:hypothetical protein
VLPGWAGHGLPRYLDDAGRRIEPGRQQLWERVTSWADQLIDRK